MVTLTLDGDGRALEGNAARLARGWRKVYRHLRRVAGLTAYAWVREIGPHGGRLHMHAIVNCKRFDYRDARRIIAASELGNVCDFKRLKFSATSYITKYLTKSPGVRFPQYMRRAQTSVHVKHEPNPDWILIRGVRPTWLRRPEPERIMPTDEESQIRAEALALMKGEKVYPDLRFGPLFCGP